MDLHTHVYWGVVHSLDPDLAAYCIWDVELTVETIEANPAATLSRR